MKQNNKTENYRERRKFFKKNFRYQLPVLVCILAAAVLLVIPTGYEDALNYVGTERCRAEVLSTNDSAIKDTGLIRSGEQICELKILDGIFKGRIAEGVNQLQGSLESDKIYQPGDIAYVVIDYNTDEIGYIMMVDHYRINSELLLAGLFILLLIVFAGKTGLRAVYSFILTVLMLWKVLIPCYLKGFDPILAGIVITVLLTILIIALVYGFDKRLLSAGSGAVLGVFAACLVGAVFTNMFKIHGAVMAYSESLLYSGYSDLNLNKIFTAGIFIGSSGAMMDLAVDITSAVQEVVRNCPGIGRREAIRSGMNVGRAAMGTMTTTLLLAYSGGYLALLMVFMAQGTPIGHILNYKYVSAEILDTIVGSFGLVTVAPFTAVCAGIILTGEKNEEKEDSISDI